MASALDVAIETENLLVRSDQEEVNRLASAIDADDVALDLDLEPSGLAAGAKLSIDWEYLRLWVGSGRSWTDVERGIEGSTAAVHADGAHVTVNPRFPRHRILAAINAELDDLSSPVNGLYKVASLDVTAASGTHGYDLDDDFYSEDAILDVSWEPTGSTKGRRYLKRGEFTIGTGLDTGDFASGNAIFFRGISDGYAVRVRYSTPFTHITTATADVAATSGLPATALDILPLGAAIRLLNPLEPARNYIGSQGDTRRAQEVPPGAIDRGVRPLREMRHERIKAEATRLRQRYPMVLR